MSAVPEQPEPIQALALPIKRSHQRKPIEPNRKCLECGWPLSVYNPQEYHPTCLPTAGPQPIAVFHLPRTAYCFTCRTVEDVKGSETMPKVAGQSDQAVRHTCILRCGHTAVVIGRA